MIWAGFGPVDNTEIKITLVNSHGGQVFADDVLSSQGENEYNFASTSDLQPGIYVLNIIHDGEIQSSVKLIKQ